MSWMWITLVIYFDLSHVSIFVTSIDICSSLLSLSGLNTRYMMKTMYTWKDTVTWVHIQIGNEFDECYMGHHAKQIWDITQNKYSFVLFNVFGVLFLLWCLFFFLIFIFRVKLCILHRYFFFLTGTQETIHTPHQLMYTGKQISSVRGGDQDYYTRF